MVKKFIKKPVVIEAVQWNGKNFDEVSNFTREFHGHKVAYEDAEELAYKTGEYFLYHKHTNNEPAKVLAGDWIIKGENGEFYHCKPDAFESIYEAVIPDDVQKAYKFIQECHSDIGFMGSPDYDAAKKLVANYEISK